MSYAQLAASVQQLNTTNLELVDSVLAVQTAANQAVETANAAMQAITALGAATVVPAPNQVPRADAMGKIHDAWLPDSVLRTTQLEPLQSEVTRIRAHAPIDLVSDYGAIPGVDDVITWEINTQALQRATDAAMAEGRAIRAPAGHFYFGNNTATNYQMSGAGDLILFGAGMFKTFFHYNDRASSSRRDFLRGSAVNLGLFDITIEGDWGQEDDYTNRSHLVAVTYSEGYVAERVRIKNSRYMAMVVSRGKTAYVSGCHIIGAAADGIRLTAAKNISVVDNYGQSVNDDWIACHWLDSLPAPVDRTVNISGNISVDCQGITVMGGRCTTITRNILIRPHTRAIMVGASDRTDSSGTEGNTPPMVILIQGNVITDLFRGSTFSSLTGVGLGWIVITNTNPTKGGAAGYVGGPDGVGNIIEPYDYLYANDIDMVGNTNPGGWMIDVSGNVCMRTLRPVSAYSNYGFGQRLSRLGPVDPAITQEDFDSVGYQVRVLGSGNGIRVRGNTLFGGYQPVWFNGRYGQGYVTWVDCDVVGNLIANYRGGSAIRLTGDGLFELGQNIIDGDPFLKHPARGANGTWGASYGDHSAFWLEGARAVARNNTIKNVGTIFTGATIDRVLWESNTLVCNPSGLNYHVGNVGIGDISTVSRMDSRFVIMDGNPNSVTFGHVLNICLKGATALPVVADKYVAGSRLRKSGITIETDGSGRKFVTDEWLRMTTGTLHVLGTDWVELRKYIE